MKSKAGILSIIAVILFLVPLEACKKQALELGPVSLNKGDELVKVFELKDKSKDYKLMLQCDRLPEAHTTKVNVNGKTLTGSFSSDTASDGTQWFSIPVSQKYLDHINGIVVKNSSEIPLNISCDQLKDKNNACGIKRQATHTRLTKLTVSPRIKLVPATKAEF